MAIPPLDPIYLALGGFGAGSSFRTNPQGVGLLKAVQDIHRLYLACSSGDIAVRRIVASGAACPQLGVLLSYHYFKDCDIDKVFAPLLDKVSFFADSGAFSAVTCGAQIDYSAYCAWLRRWEHRFSCAASLDVIGDAKASRVAAEAMLSQNWSIPILPVFHMGSDWEHLTHWVGKVNYLALGGMVPFCANKPLLIKWARKCFSLLPPSMRVHGFGVTSWPVMRAVPWTTLDSSSWSSGARFAEIRLFDPRTGIEDQIAVRSRKALLAKDELLQRYYGVTAAQCLDAVSQRKEPFAPIFQAAILSTLRAWVYAQERWQKGIWNVPRACEPQSATPSSGAPPSGGLQPAHDHALCADGAQELAP